MFYFKRTQNLFLQSENVDRNRYSATSEGFVVARVQLCLFTLITQAAQYTQKRMLSGAHVLKNFDASININYDAAYSSWRSVFVEM